jgi:hypothetical protein
MTCGGGLFHDLSPVKAHRYGTVGSLCLGLFPLPTVLPWGEGSGVGLRRQGREGEGLVCVRR